MFYCKNNPRKTLKIKSCFFYKLLVILALSYLNYGKQKKSKS